MDEERLRQLEKEHALLEQRVDENIKSDEEFRKKVVTDLDCIKESNIRRDESLAKVGEWLTAKAEFWQELKTRMAYAGIWGVIVLLSGIVWYAIKQFLHIGGN